MVKRIGSNEWVFFLNFAPLHLSYLFGRKYAFENIANEFKVWLTLNSIRIRRCPRKIQKKIPPELCSRKVYLLKGCHFQGLSSPLPTLSPPCPHQVDRYLRILNGAVVCYEHNDSVCLEFSRIFKKLHKNNRPDVIQICHLAILVSSMHTLADLKSISHFSCVWIVFFSGDVQTRNEYMRKC